MKPGHLFRYRDIDKITVNVTFIKLLNVKVTAVLRFITCTAGGRGTQTYWGLLSRVGHSQPADVFGK